VIATIARHAGARSYSIAKDLHAVERALIRSPIAVYRIERAAAWLAERRRGEEVLVLGASYDAGSELSRAVSLRMGASFGWQRSTLGRIAAVLAGPELARRGLAPVGALPLEALCSRVVDTLRRDDALGRFASVAEFPGLPRALARTLGEIRIAGVDPEDLRGEGGAELARAHRVYEAELLREGLADRALILRIATMVAADTIAPARPKGASSIGGILDRPLLLLDVPISGLLERDLVTAMAARAPSVLATVPAGDERSLVHLRGALGIAPELRGGEDDAKGSPSSLRRLQAYLFSEAPAKVGDLGDDVVILSAPGESRECVEIARIAQKEAARGVPFDRMAILLRAPQQYRSHIEEALGRAGIPAHFAKGTVRPDPAGRAFVALLACGAEKLSARRFAEYLSLGQVPDATAEGEPPSPLPAAERWVPPDEDLVRSSVIEVSPPPGAAPQESLEEEEEFAPDSSASPLPATAGTLRAPRRWERLLLESAVIGGIDRWESRLEALHKRLVHDRMALESEGDPAEAYIRRSLEDLAALRRFALPILRAIAALPAQATWGEWLERLSALATQSLRRPERVLAVLAELAPMAAVSPVSFDEVRLVLGRRLTDLVVLPEERSAGRVFVGPVEAARGLAFDVVFVPGLAEKLFPQKVSEDPILLDRVRAPLGLDTNDERIAAERLALRLAVGAARHRLVLSYPRVDMDQSRPRVPSFYALELIRAAEGRLLGFDELGRRAEQGARARIGWPAPPEPKDAIDHAEYDLALLEALFQRPEAEAAGAAHYLLGENEHLARALRSRARRWTVKKWVSVDGLVDPTGPARASLDRHSLEARTFSPTALQTFATCPYKFLLFAIHRLSPRPSPEAIEEMDPLQRGTLVHEALYEVLDALRREDMLPVTPETLDHARARLDRVLDRIAARYKDELAPAIDRVWEGGIASIRADLREWLRRAAEDTTWTPWRFELSFGLRQRRDPDTSSGEAPLALDCGIKLRGSVDLVERNGDGALRATDYKTGKVRAKPGVTVVDGGRMLQPVFYALALEKLFPEATVEAGRLYYCTSAGGFEEVLIPLNEEARRAADVVADVIGKALKEGFLPAAPEPGACEYCDYRVVCGPYEEMRTARKSPERLTALRVLRRLP
jgi:CRISPR/Cas system-associated exonuclease Cas4 (RecB family)